MCACESHKWSFSWQIYDVLNIQGLSERGESFYNPYLKDVVDDLEEQGLAVESEGATAVFVDGVSQKKDQEEVDVLYMCVPDPAFCFL